MNQALETALNFIYPKVCGGCREINKNALCNKCKIKIEKDLKIEKIINQDNTVFYNEKMFLFQYDGFVRKIMIDYKYKGKSYLYETFVKIMINNEKICGFLKSYDIIIPVPMHKSRRRRNGYQYNELIAKALTQYIEPLQYKKEILQKPISNFPQSQLNKIQRKQNVKNVYGIKNKEIIKKKKVLLFDDIDTTGNTIIECSRILKQQEVEKIGVFIIAKD